MRVEVAGLAAGAGCACGSTSTPRQTPPFMVDGQRLRAAHAAEPAGDDQLARAVVPPKCWRAQPAKVS